jgi:diaminopimelate epimerase
MLQKWNGAGNDFLVDVGSARDLEQWNADSARRVCDRIEGLGADGLLLVASDSVPPTMTLFNADGSLAGMSGNGIRCLVGALRRATQSDWSDVVIETAAGRRAVHVDMENPEKGRGSVSMGVVAFRTTPPEALGAADVGNPHVVVRDRAEWSDTEREKLARRYQEQEGGANVEFVSVIHPGRVAIKVYERGVGWTQACGTGSVATAAIMHSLGETGTRIVVENPGGELVVTLDGSAATLGGPMVFEYEREWAL